MQERIEELRKVSQALEPTAEQREVWTKKVVGHAERIFQSLPQSPAFHRSDDEGKGIFGSAIAEEPHNVDELLKLLAQHVEAAGVKLGSPGYLAFIPMSTFYPAALGDFLSAAINPYAGNFFASPGAVRLEHLLTRWMAKMVGYPESSAGDLTSGGSLANLGGVVAARQAKGLKAREYEKAVVYLTSQTHHSITKALRIAGLGECVQRVIALDAAYHMRPEILEQQIRDDKKAGLLPWLVVAAAGSTDTGAVDPLIALSQIAQVHQLWLHVDGAYGAMFTLCQPGRKVLAGMDQSDSLILDPHKGLFMPCGSGALLVRQGTHLLQAYRYQASYMQDRGSLASLDEVSPSELSAELTRPFRGLRLWLSLKLLGLRPFRAALEEKLLLARYFYERLREIKSVQIGPPPDLSIVAFRWSPQTGNADEYNQRLLQAVQRDGRVFMTSTSLNGQFWLRLAILCNATHREHIDLALQILEENSKQI